MGEGLNNKWDGMAIGRTCPLAATVPATLRMADLAFVIGFIEGMSLGRQADRGPLTCSG